MKEKTEERLPYYRFTEREVSELRNFAMTRIDNDMMVELFTSPEISEFELVYGDTITVFKKLIDPMVVHAGFSASIRRGKVGIVFNGGLTMADDAVDLVCDFRGLIGKCDADSPFLKSMAQNAVFDYLAIQYMKRFGGASIIDD